MFFYFIYYLFSGSIDLYFISELECTIGILRCGELCYFFFFLFSTLFVSTGVGGSDILNTSRFAGCFFVLSINFFIRKPLHQCLTGM